MKVKVNGNTYETEVSGNTAFVNGKEIAINASNGLLKIGGKEFRVDFADENRSFMIINGIAYEVSKGGSDKESVREIVAPIGGKIVDVTERMDVKEGDVLLVIEAMKMENQIKSPVTGKIREIRVSHGQAVRTGETLIIFE